MGDKGSVIVGARLAVEDRELSGHEHSPSMKQKEEEQQEEHEHDGVEEEVEEEIETIEKLTKHFSYYAFDGRTGALRWKHDFMDFFDVTHNHKGISNEDSHEHVSVMIELTYDNRDYYLSIVISCTLLVMQI